MTDHLFQPVYLRLPQIIGRAGLTEEQATANRNAGRGPTRARASIAPLIPVCKSTWWAGVKVGRYPAPIKLGPRITVWLAEDIRTLAQPNRSSDSVDPLHSVHATATHPGATE